MMNQQMQEIPHVDYPYEVSPDPIDQPEVEITTPHPVPDSPGAEMPKQASNPIGFTAK